MKTFFRELWAHPAPLKYAHLGYLFMTVAGLLFRLIRHNLSRADLLIFGAGFSAVFIFFFAMIIHFRAAIGPKWRRNYLIIILLYLVTGVLFGVPAFAALKQAMGG